MKKITKAAIFLRGVISQNPALVLVLGLCPTLAVTTSLENGLGMGLATLAVLVFSNLMISFMRNFTPSKIRIPIFIVVIATFVTIIAMLMEAFAKDLFASLGIYVPLIVVNCIVLGRAEAFASKNTPFKSVIDGLGMGTGFTLALVLIGGIREILGASKLILFGHTLFSIPTPAMGIMLLPPGAYFVMGLLLAMFNVIGKRKKSKK